MADETASLIIKVQSDQVATAKSRLNELGYTATTAERATDGLTRAFKGLVTAAAAMAIFNKAKDDIAEFQNKMVGIQAVTDATAAQMLEMSEAAKDFSRTTKFSAAEAAEGMRQLGQAGFSTTQIIAAMPGMLDLATAGELSIADAADAVAASLAGFRMKAGESARVADVFAVAASASNTSVAGLAEGMKYVAPIAASMGMSIETTAGALGVLSNAGLQGSMAGTGLRQVLSSLASPTKEARDILEAYGLTAKEVNPATNDLATVIERLREKGLSAGDALTIFGDRGAPAILALTNQVPALTSLNTQLDNSAGRAKKMADIMGSDLAGDLRKLSNSFKTLGVDIGEAGLDKALRDAAQGATTFVYALDDLVKSGEAAAWVEVLQSKFMMVGGGFQDLVTNITDLWALAMDWVEGDGASTVNTIIDMFVLLPENVRAATQSVGATFGMWVEYAGAAGKGIWETISAWFNYLIDTASNVGKEIMSHLNPKAADFDYTKAQAEAYDRFSKTVSQSWENVTANIDGATRAWEEQLGVIFKEWEVNVASSDAQIQKIKELREAYAKLQADRKAAADAAGKNAGTVTGKGGGPVDTSGVTDRYDVAGFNALKFQLQGEEAVVMESYRKRLELIRANTKEGSDLRIQLEKELQERLKLELDEAHQQTIDRLTSQHEAEQANLQLQLDQRLITEQEYQQKSRAAWDAYSKGIVAVGTKGTAAVSTKQLEMWSSTLSMAGQMANLMTQLVGENNAAAKAMFAISKAIAIAEILINTHVGAAKAVGLMGPFGIPMSKLILANGYASAALTAAIAIGQFEHGGMIPAGGYGVVGETGVPELVKGPAVVTSARTTADLMSGGRSGGGATIVNIHNYTNAEATVQERETADGKVVDVIVKRVKSELTSDVRSGGSGFTRAMEGTYNLRRGVA